MNRTCTLFILMIAVFLAPALAGSEDGMCCRQTFKKCLGAGEDILCDNCIDQDCEEISVYHPAYAVCNCDYVTGSSGCSRGTEVYCTFHFPCMEIPGGCTKASLSSCSPDWDDPNPYYEDGTMISRSETGVNCEWD